MAKGETDGYAMVSATQTNGTYMALAMNSSTAKAFAYWGVDSSLSPRRMYEGLPLPGDGPINSTPGQPDTYDDKWLHVVDKIPVIPPGASVTREVQYMLKEGATRAAVTFTPSPEVFTDTLVGSTSGAQTVTVTNSGSEPVEFGANALALGGTNPTEFGFSNDTCSGQTVAVGSSCTVDVTISPTSTGAKSALLQFASDVDGSPHSMTLAGTGVAPGFSAAPDPVDAGSVLVGQSSGAQTVTVTNSGTAGLEFGASAVTVSGTDSGQFSIDTDNCSSTTVDPADTCTVEVKFSPTSVGAKSASLQFADNAAGSPHGVALSGIGIAPTFSGPTDPVGLGAAAVGQTAGPQTVTITNNGTADLTFNAGGVTLAGANPGEFAVATDNCSGATLPPGASCTVQVNFAPTSAGAKSASLQFASSAAGSPHVVALSGTGLAPAFAGATDPVAVGSVPVGQTSGRQPVTITNNGTAPMVSGAGAVALTGADREQFAVATDNCSGSTLPVGATCTVEVTFSPTSGGVKSASLQFTSNAAGSPHSVPLTGTGLVPVTPQLSTPTATVDGFVLDITDYATHVAAWWTFAVDPPTGGKAALDPATGRITVTGLTPGQSATVTVRASRPGYPTGTTVETSKALEPVAVTFSGLPETVVVGSPVTLTVRVSQPDNPSGAGINGTVTITINGASQCQAQIVNGVGTCTFVMRSSGKLIVAAAFTGYAPGSSQQVTTTANSQTAAAKVVITGTNIKSTSSGKAVVRVSGAAASRAKVTLKMKVNGRWTKVGTATPNKSKNWKIDAKVSAQSVQFRAQQGKSESAIVQVAIPVDARHPGSD